MKVQRTQFYLTFAMNHGSLLNVSSEYFESVVVVFQKEIRHKL